MLRPNRKNACAVYPAHGIPVVILKSAVERGSFDQTMDEMDVVDPVDFTRKGISFLVRFVHKVHDVRRLRTGLGFRLPNPGCIARWKKA